jgi:hypothetical protein
MYIVANDYVQSQAISVMFLLRARDVTVLNARSRSDGCKEEGLIPPPQICIKCCWNSVMRSVVLTST